MTLFQIFCILCPFLIFSGTISSLEASVETQIDSSQTLVSILEDMVNLSREHESHSESPIPIYAIGGCPGVGKTYLAKVLLQELRLRGVKCALLPLDHFNLSALDRKKIGTEWDPRYLKIEELHRVLQAVTSGKNKIHKPVYQQSTGESGEEEWNL